MSGHFSGLTNRPSSGGIYGYTNIQGQNTNLQPDTIYQSGVPTSFGLWQQKGSVCSNSFNSRSRATTAIMGNQILSPGFQSVFAGIVPPATHLTSQHRDASQPYIMTNVANPQGVAQSNQQQSKSCSSINTNTTENVGQAAMFDCVNQHLHGGNLRHVSLQPQSPKLNVTTHMNQIPLILMQ